MTTPDLHAVPPLDRPTVDDVAALLRARTKDLTGTETGTFNDDTRPTGTEVERLIDMAYAEVTGQSGAYLGVACAALGKALVVIRAAMWVELSYFPEQVRSDRSVYAELAQQWTDGMPALVACVQGNTPADGGDTKAGYRFGVLDVHGWTASPYYGAPEVPATVPPTAPPNPPDVVFASTWAWADYVVSSPVGAGFIGVDAAAPADASHLWVSSVDRIGVDYTAMFGAVEAGDCVYVQRQNDPTGWVRYSVATAPIVNGGNFVMAVALDDGSPANQPGGVVDVVAVFQLP